MVAACVGACMHACVCACINFSCAGEWGPRLRSSRVPRAIPMPRSARFPRSAREHQGQNEEQRETSPGACRANVDSRAEGELRATTAEETLASRREFRGQNSPESAAASYRRARPGVRRPGLSRNISRDHQIRSPARSLTPLGYPWSLTLAHTCFTISFRGRGLSFLSLLSPGQRM
jgi:hypothetical protein